MDTNILIILLAIAGFVLAINSILQTINIKRMSEELQTLRATPYMTNEHILNMLESLDRRMIDLEGMVGPLKLDLQLLTNYQEDLKMYLDNKFQPIDNAKIIAHVKGVCGGVKKEDK